MKNPPVRAGSSGSAGENHRLATMIFPKALRFVKRKGSFSQRERLA
jgi:hypothetical protein